MRTKSDQTVAFFMFLVKLQLTWLSI